MKILKPRYDLVALFFPIFIGIALLAYFFYLPLLSHLAKINWLFNVLLLVIFITPRGKIKLGQQTKLSRLRWYGALFIVQLLLNTLLWGFTHFIYTLSATDNVAAPIDVLQFTLSSGLFPFGFLLLVTLMASYFTYVKKQPDIVENAFKLFFGNSPTDSVGVGVNSYIRLMSNFVLTFLLGMLCMHLIYFWFAWAGIKLPFGLKVDVILICCGLFIVARHQNTTKLLQQLLDWKISDWLVLVFFTVALSIAYFLFGLITTFLVPTNPYAELSFLTLNVHLLNDYLRLILTFMGYGFAIVAGGAIAACSISRSSREIIITALITNLLSWALIYLLEQAVRKAGFTFIPWCADIICILVASAFLLKKKNVTYFMRATLPNELTKQRSTVYLMRSLPQVITLFVTTYVTMGIYFLTVSTVLIVLPSLVLILIAFVSFFVQLLKGSLD